jgi:hypothetical protein
MLLISAYCGLESPELSPVQCRERLSNLAARHLPNGHTMIDARGCWLSPERGIVQEPTIVLQVFAERGDHIHQALLTVARLYKNEACQDAVIVTAQEVDADFI